MELDAKVKSVARRQFLSSIYSVQKKILDWVFRFGEVMEMIGLKTTTAIVLIIGCMLLAACFDEPDLSKQTILQRNSLYADPSQISDEIFFNEKLDYANYSSLATNSLAAVEYHRDRGDYAAAKQSLLGYYTGRNETNEFYSLFDVEEWLAADTDELTAHENNAELICDNTFSLSGKEIYVGEMVFPNKYDEDVEYLQSLDVTNHVIKETDSKNDMKISFFVIGKHKSHSLVVINSSNNSEYGPILHVEYTDNTSEDVAPSDDTYIEAGKPSSNFATRTTLAVKSHLSPFGDYERRIFLKFKKDFNDKSVRKATLWLYGKNVSADTGALAVNIFRTTNKSWEEDKLTWDNAACSTFSWGDNFVGEMVFPNVDDADANYDQALDVTSHVEQELDNRITFALMGKQSASSLVSINSAEDDSNKPILRIEYSDNTVVNNAAINDTYILNGNPDDNYGYRKELLVKSAEEPYKSYERRSYLQFAIPPVDESDGKTVKKSTLLLFGQNVSQGEGSLPVLVFRSPNDNWSEGQLTWNNLKPETFSWDTHYDGPDWKQPTSGAREQWSFHLNRFTDIKSLLVAGDHTTSQKSKERYIDKYISLIIDYIKDNENYFIDLSGTWDTDAARTLDSSIRIEEWIKAHCYLTSAEENNAFDANAHTAFMKNIWSVANWLMEPKNFHIESNWGTSEVAALYFISIYFYEFVDAPLWRAEAEKRFAALLDFLIYADGSYIEASSSYAVVGLRNLLKIWMVVKTTGSFSEALDEQKVNEKIIKLAKYVLDSSAPNGQDPGYGDGNNKLNNSDEFQAVAQAFQNEENLSAELVTIRNNLSYIGNDTENPDRVEPNYTSIMYPDDMAAVMRTGWKPSDRFLRIPTKVFKSDAEKEAEEDRLRDYDIQVPEDTDDTVNRPHRHWDMLSVVVKAFNVWLLPDAGRANYGDYNDIVKSNEYHNSVRINDTTQTSYFEDENECKFAPESGITHWVTNNRIDFFEGYTTGASTVEGFLSKRSVFFVKPNYWIVSDRIETTNTWEYHTYTQIWNTMPDSAPVVNSVTKAMKTNNEPDNKSRKDIQIVPASPNQIDYELADGYYYYSMTAYNTPNTKRLLYSQTQSGDEIATFNTVLYPTKTSDTDPEPQDVTVNTLDVFTTGTNSAIAESRAVALEVDKLGNGSNTGYYCLSHEAESLYSYDFGEYSSNGKVAYIENDTNGNHVRFSFVDGTTLSEEFGQRALIHSQASRVRDIAVFVDGDALKISGSNLMPSTHPGEAIKIYAPDTQTVILNGEVLSTFATEGPSGEYVLAVAPKSSWEFAEDNNWEGWEIKRGMTGEVSSGAMRLTFTDSNPQIMSEDNLNINADILDIVKIRVTNRTGEYGGKLFWITETDNVWNSDKGVSFHVGASTSPKEILIDLSGNENWAGTIRKIRVDPINAPPIGTTFDIGYIRVRP